MLAGSGKSSIATQKRLLSQSQSPSTVDDESGARVLHYLAPLLLRPSFVLFFTVEAELKQGAIALE
jgi:hypothetical protein